VSVSVLARALTTPLGGAVVSVVGDWSKSEREDLAGTIWVICAPGPGASCPMDGGCDFHVGDSMYGWGRQNRLFCCLKSLSDGRNHCGLKRSERGCWAAEWAMNECWDTSRSTRGGHRGLGILAWGLRGPRGRESKSTRWGCNKLGRVSACVPRRHRCPSPRDLGSVRGTLFS
jgi:hypothetical protein